MHVGRTGCVARVARQAADFRGQVIRPLELGLAALQLPNGVGESVTADTNGYDAGTEINTEDFADIIPPCPVLSGVPSSDPGTGESNPALAQNGVIEHHPGIQGGNDLLPAVHGWTDPVARITVTRIE